MERIAFEDVEGNFGRPEILKGNSVHGKLDAQHPFHPLQKSEANYHMNKDHSEMDMLRRTFGVGFPLKLQMERKAASQVGHLPCITTASRASLDALVGTDATIGFDDVMGKPENFESMTALPFNMIEKQMKFC
eukprot:TRINITY_DN567_c0_g1_i4.p1 TRINITY_DN567_c0_g1~~TRINITY_DN567_c0_g1_i4.p1  ORF type:complete len:133 (+),score=40.12 TRINITY_DN567_c0_g1_i4:61-459(+)